MGDSKPQHPTGTARRPTGLLGRPNSRAGVFYRLFRWGFLVLARGLVVARFTVEGLEHLPRTSGGRPAGGRIVVGLPHRTWVDALAVTALLPAEPRFAFFGDGEATFRDPIRSWWVRKMGGVIPIWKGGVKDSIDTYLGAVRQALDAGMNLLVFAETGPPVPVEEARPLGKGFAYFALRADVPIVPIVIGGGHELYRRRHIIIRVLPTVTPRELAGLPAEGPPPEPWSAEERAAATRIAEELHRLTAEPVARVHRDAEPPPGFRKRWLRLTTMFH